jgi:acetyl esterase
VPCLRCAPSGAGPSRGADPARLPPESGGYPDDMSECGARIRRVAVSAVVALLGSVAAGAQAAPARTGVRAPSGSAPIEIERDIAYPAAGGAASRLDAYVVAGSAAGAHAAPAIVLVHGGGWQSGDKASLAGIATAFAQAGFSSFSVDYRLAPAAPYPAAVEDVAAALRWLREPAQVQRFGIDPARIGLFGVSAGGTIAAWVAMSGTGPLDQGARVRAVASWSGPMVLDRYAVRRTPASPNSSVVAYLGCDPHKCRSRERDASPVTHVDGSDPPMLVVNSRHELVPTDQARAMDVMLGDAGVDHRLLLFDGGRHAEQLAPLALAPTLSFFRHALG